MLNEIKMYIMNKNGGQSRVSGIVEPSLEHKILKEIVPRIKFIKSYPRSTDIINKAILPAFADLYARWPEGYKLLMKNKFVLYVANKDMDEFFKTYGSYIGKNKAVRNAIIVSKLSNGNPVVFIDAAGRYSAPFLNKEIYRSIMLLADEFALKGSKSKYKYLSGQLDLQFDKKLTRIAANYMERLNKAEAEFNKRVRENGSGDHKKTYGALINIMDKHHCWAYKKFDPEDEKISSYPFKYCLFYPHNPRELISNGLVFYFGSPQERQRLEKFEPKLYQIIEEFVIPRVKKTLLLQPAKC